MSLSRYVQRLIVVGLTLGLALSIGAAEAGPAPIGFGLLSVQSPAEVEAMWAPVLAALSRQLGVEVKPHIAKDYAGLIWAMRAGQDQIAWFGNKSAMEAIDNAGAEVFAQEVYATGEAGYHSHLIVNKTSTLNGVDDVFAHASQLTFSIGDQNSTSGYLVPLYHLFARHSDLQTLFRRVTRGNHEENFLAVAEGRVDVATVASTVLDRMAHSHADQWAKLRIVWTSPLIPADPLVWRKDLPDEMKQRVRDVLLGYGMAAPGKSAASLAQERAALAAIGVVRFTASDDRQLVPIRKLELFKTRLATEADPSLPADDRRRRTDAIDHRLAELEQTTPAAPPSN